MTKKHVKKGVVAKALNEALIKAVVNTESHCSYDGNKVLITGSTKNLDNRGLAISAVLEPDQFLWLKLVKNVYKISIDHSNGYDSSKTGWIPSLAYYAVGEDGVEHHYFGGTLLKEYPGKGNWSYRF